MYLHESPSALEGETCSRRESVDGDKTGMLVGTEEHSREHSELGGRLRTPIV